MEHGVSVRRRSRTALDRTTWRSSLLRIVDHGDSTFRQASVGRLDEARGGHNCIVERRDARMSLTGFRKTRSRGTHSLVVSACDPMASVVAAAWSDGYFHAASCSTQSDMEPVHGLGAPPGNRDRTAQRAQLAQQLEQ